MSNVGHSTPSPTNSANRLRFCSAPSPTASAPWPPQLPNSLWSRLDDGARCLHQRTKSLVSSYAPSDWQPIILENVDRVATRLETTFDRDNRSRLGDLFSSIDNFSPSIRYAIVASSIALLIVVFLLVHTFLVALLLGFGLPFYAITVVVYWFVSWRRNCARSIDEQGPGYKMLNYWWCAVVVTDFIIFIIVCTTTSSSTQQSRWLYTVLNYGLPLLAFLGAKLYLDLGRRKADSDDEDDDQDFFKYAWLLEYFVLTYATRCFALRGFTLLPEGLRVFVGHAASYAGAVTAAIEKKSLSSSSKSSGASSCDHCCPPGAVSASTSLGSIRAGPPSQLPQLVLSTAAAASSSGGVGGVGGGPSPTHRNRFHLSDGDPLRAMAAAGGGRGSRRVSLPAGSLLPIKAAQSNLSEARGMLADMLAQKDLPPHMVAGLKAVSSLLVPGSNQAQLATQFDFLGNIPRVFDSPYIGGDVSLASVESAAQRRQSPSVVWSTTTSATGLPTLEPEPSRARSSSYWKQKHLVDGESEDGKGALLKQSVDLPSKLLQLSDGTIYDLADIGRDPYLARLKEWSLPIFELYADSPETILSRVAYTVFQKSGLFRIFKINKQKFLSFFHALEKGYWNIPYHNRVHATDVVHATYYFTSHKVSAFAEVAKVSHTLGSIGEQSEEDDEDEDRENDEHETADLLTKTPPSNLDNPSGTLASILSSLELMGLFTAAAMHDFDHPGRTNAFLVAIQDKKATLYNDRSVLENHHAASAWQLLTKPENNFVEQLDAAEFKRFRYIIIEAILATDLKRHFEILMDFNGKIAKGLDWDNETDKLLTCQMCMKMADINSPTKPGSLHKDWTDRILEEFYAQGDEEKERGLPVSPYMDRHDANLARLQDSFIAHLVGPLAQAMNEAGLLPLTIADSSGDPSQTSMKSELLVNLEINHKHWKVELGEDPASAVQAVGVLVSNSARGTGSPLPKEEDEMETIQEQEDENGAGD